MLKTRRTPRTTTSELELPAPEPEETRRRPRRHDVTVAREVFELLATGDLHPGHLLVATTVASIVVTGRVPAPPHAGAARAIEYDPETMTITVVQQRGGLLYDGDDRGQFSRWLAWSRGLAAHGLIELHEPGAGIVRIRPAGALLKSATRSR